MQHVGSTSVPGLAAKPIIDIDLIISKREHLIPVVEKLQLLGYEHLGDMGIQGREAFKRQSDSVPFTDNIGNWPKHNLYVCLAGSNSLLNLIAFRDFLRSNPDQVKVYGDLKKSLALQYPYDIDRYVAGKTPFITGILSEIGFSEQAINEIAHDNSIGSIKGNN